MQNMQVAPSAAITLKKTLIATQGSFRKKQFLQKRPRVHYHSFAAFRSFVRPFVRSSVRSFVAKIFRRRENLLDGAKI